jgi:hypothetical protein
MDSSTTFRPNLTFCRNESSYSNGDFGAKFDTFLSWQYLEPILFILGDKDPRPENMSCEHLISGVAKSHSVCTLHPTMQSLNVIRLGNFEKAFLTTREVPRLLQNWGHCWIGG